MSVKYLGSTENGEKVEMAIDVVSGLKNVTIELEIQNVIRQALNVERENLIESLLRRIEDGMVMVRDNTSTPEDALQMIALQCERIRAFDKIIKDRTFL